MAVQLSDVTASGTESLLGISDDLDAPTMRERLALATRYLANWYKATQGSDNQAVWWQQIDAIRAKVEATYAELQAPLNQYFADRQSKADYDDASKAWVDLYNTIVLSADANQYTLLNQAADFVTTIGQAPGLIIPSIAEDVGAVLGDSARRFFAEAWPFILAVGVVGGVYIFRGPLLKLAGKVI